MRLSLNTHIMMCCFVLVILLAIIGLAQQSRSVSSFHGTQLSEPQTPQPFNLIGMDGKPFNEQFLLNRWTLVFFGFTQCQAICPTTMTELARMIKQLEQSKTQHMPQVVMISLDPTQDSLVKLAHFVTAFNPSFYGATGDVAQIRALTQSLGIAYQANAKTIDHSGALILFNPEGKIIAYFTPPHDALTLARDFRFLLTLHHKGT